MPSEQNPTLLIGLMLVTVLVVSGCTISKDIDRTEVWCQDKGYDNYDYECCDKVSTLEKIVFIQDKQCHRFCFKINNDSLVVREFDSFRGNYSFVDSEIQGDICG